MGFGGGYFRGHFIVPIWRRIPQSVVQCLALLFINLHVQNIKYKNRDRDDSGVEDLHLRNRGMFLERWSSLGEDDSRRVTRKCGQISLPK